MNDPVAALIVDLLEWIGDEKSYEEVLRVWRTSCPRLPVWEEATERGLVVRDHTATGSATVRITAEGRAFIEQTRPPAR